MKTNINLYIGRNRSTRLKKDRSVIVKTNMRLLMITIACLLSSCATLTPTEKGEPTRLMYIEGVVQGISGNELVLELRLPEFKKTSEDSIGDIAH